MVTSVVSSLHLEALSRTIAITGEHVADGTRIWPLDMREINAGSRVSSVIHYTETMFHGMMQVTCHEIYDTIDRICHLTKS